MNPPFVALFSEVEVDAVGVAEGLDSHGGGVGEDDVVDDEVAVFGEGGAEARGVGVKAVYGVSRGC